MRRAVGIAGLLFALTVTMGACGGAGGAGDGAGSGGQTPAPGSGSSPPETAGSPNTLPEEGPLDVGKIRTTKFEPAFTFEVGEGWVSVGPEFEEAIFMARAGERYLSFLSPQKVYDPKEPAEQREMPAPDTVEGWVDWHRENRYFVVSEAEPASVGDASGMRFHLEVASAPKKGTEICGAPCVPGFPIGPTANDYFLGYEEQDYVLDVGGEIVIVSVTATEGDLEKFLPEARKVMETVEWEAGS